MSTVLYLETRYLPKFESTAQFPCMLMLAGTSLHGPIVTWYDLRHFFCRAAGFCDLLLENTSKKSGKSVPISKSFTDLLQSCPQIDGVVLIRIMF